jgi:transposase
VSSLWKSLPAATAETARARLRSGCAAVDKEMRREGVTLVLLWAVSRRASGRVWLYYSWFSEHYDAFKSRLRPTMRQSYSAGEKVFADFAGDAIDVVDPTTAEVRSMKLFVAVMGASNYIFAQARPSEQVAIWIDAHVDLFAFLGGLPEVRGLRQSQSGRHKPGPLRAGPEPSQVLST